MGSVKSAVADDHVIEEESKNETRSILDLAEKDQVKEMRM